MKFDSEQAMYVTIWCMVCITIITVALSAASCIKSGAWGTYLDQPEQRIERNQ